jgi:DegV family protein with EDD domain
VSHVAVITDSTASLPEDLYERHGILKVPYYVHIGQRALRDTVDISAADLATYMLGLADGDQVPTTANPGPGDYVEAFLAAAERAQEIFSFHMTSVGSGAYQAALIGRDMVLQTMERLRIHVIDTRNVSMCHGWISLEAARAAQAGARGDEIRALIDRMLPVTRMLQTADSLRYLYMGGRIGRAQHLVGSLLNVKPIVSMDDGVIVTAGVARSRDGSFRRITSLLERAVGAGRRVRLAMTHAAAHEDAQRLLDMARRVVTCTEPLMCDLSPALTVHSGPGTVGLCYVPEDAIAPTS